MDIHHAMVVHSAPEQVYRALTSQADLEAWMDAPALAAAEVGGLIEFHYDQGRRLLKVEITRLEPGQSVGWRVIQPMWPKVEVEQTVLWTLSPFEGSTLVDFRMQGWPQDDGIYASVSYKWAQFMVRLKVHLGDTREMASLLGKR